MFDAQDKREVIASILNKNQHGRNIFLKLLEVLDTDKIESKQKASKLFSDLVQQHVAQGFGFTSSRKLIDNVSDVQGIRTHGAKAFFDSQEGESLKGKHHKAARSTSSLGAEVVTYIKELNASGELLPFVLSVTNQYDQPGMSDFRSYVKRLYKIEIEATKPELKDKYTIREDGVIQLHAAENSRANGPR